jgi:hypothetical protein
LDLFGQYADAAPALLAAESYNQRWLVVRPLGDQTAPALDELFSQPAARGPETAEELLALEEELLARANGNLGARAVPRDRKWLKAALAALKIGIPMFAPEAAQWVGVLDLLAN